MFLAPKLRKWVQNQLISQDQADSILAFEDQKGKSRVFFALGGLGAFSIILGIASLVAANWYKIPPELKVFSHTTINLVLGWVIFKYFSRPSWIREFLVSLLAGLCLTYIGLIGQVLQTQSHLWKPLGVWLVLVTPMLLRETRFSGIVTMWFIVLGVFSVDLGEYVLGREAERIFYPALPFCLYAITRFTAFQERFPSWADTTSRLFWSLAVIATLVLQSFWDCGMGNYCWAKIPHESLLVTGVGVLALFLLNVGQRAGACPFWAKEDSTWNVVMLVSFAFAAAPVIIPHGEIEILGVLGFCFYALFMGAIGVRLNLDRLWSLAVLAIGVRLFVAFVDIMGSLALQGLGFILTGLLFIGMAFAVRKIIKSKDLLAEIVGREKGGE